MEELNLKIDYPGEEARTPAEPQSPKTAEAGPRSDAPIAPGPSSFKPKIPRRLADDEARRRKAAAVGGVGLGLVISLLIYGFSPQNSTLHTMFDFTRLDAIIPVVILCMFCWGMWLRASRRRRVIALEQACRRQDVLKATRALQAEGLDRVLASVTPEAVAANPLARRLKAALEQWRTKPDVVLVDNVLEQHAAFDGDEVHSSYSLLRTFIWALPVLGLIGTVIGISVAVGGFAQFLGGDIDDVSVIKSNLVHITAGLSYAFLITLLGLATSLVLMLLTSATQTREENAYSSLQQALAEDLLPVLQQQEIPAEPDPAQDPHLWRDAMLESTEAIVKRTGDLFDHLQTQMVGRLSELHRQEAELMRERHQEAAQVLVAASHTVAGTLREATDEFAVRVLPALNELPKMLFQVQNQLAEQSSRQQKTSEALMEGIAAAVDRWAETSKDATAALAGVQHAADRLAEAGQAAEQILRNADLEKIRKATDEHDAVARRQAEALEAAARGAESLQTVVGAAASAQTQLAGALLELKQSGVAGALAALPASIQDLTPVLRAFREPFVLQAVSVPMRTAAAADGRG